MATETLDRHLKLYEQACKEETGQFEFYLKGIAFHFGLVSALLGADLVGAFQAKPGLLTLLLLAGPAMTFIAAHLGLTSTSRLYQGWLEKVATRAKYEQILGLTKPDHATEGYWLKEPLVPTRHVHDRSEANSSAAFVADKVRRGYHLQIRVLFIAAEVVAVFLFAVIAWLTCSTWPAGVK